MLSTTLRRVLVASGLVIATSGFMGAAAFAQTTGSATLSGTVASTLQLTTTPTAGAAALNLAGGQTDVVVKVADLTMGTNNSTGLTLKLSAASGSLAKTDAITSVPFSVGAVAGDGSTAPASGDYKSASADTLIATTAPAVASSSPYSLFIKYTTAAFQDPSGATPYGASVNLVVTDN